ncbi:ATP-binding protein [Yeosuana sp. MJ-SS3]|uniref:ATP-binding protein n=1 Tax=Gilvirhabdus luticola TaxID=3079858 RepID=A0ABU3U7I6_9FLAO|nr:ATP-binding protein [Yeosuana sp. MJ-SS3]MDU8886368.1 ATP-binding protein [Yeosuana sp. MJ-SS3]
MNSKKIVITGGPGTGKTSVINELKSRGYFCFEEIIRTLTSQAKNESESSKHFSNPIAFVDDPLLFNTQLLNGRVEQFTQSKVLNYKKSFFDRGIPDVLAYMEFFNQPFDKVFIEACNNHIYTDVFILPPWEAIYISDNERFETFDEALKIHDCLVNVYDNFGYDIKNVPFGSISERANFIIDNI